MKRKFQFAIVRVLMVAIASLFGAAFADEIPIDAPRGNAPNISGDAAPDFSAQNRISHVGNRDRGTVDPGSGMLMLRRQLLSVRGVRNCAFTLEWDPVNKRWTTPYDIRFYSGVKNEITWGGGRETQLTVQVAQVAGGGKQSGGESAAATNTFTLGGNDYRYQNFVWNGAQGGELLFPDKSKMLFEANDVPANQAIPTTGRVSSVIDRNGRRLDCSYDRMAGGALTGIIEPVSERGMYVVYYDDNPQLIHHVYDDMGRNVYLRYQGTALNAPYTWKLLGISEPWQGASSVVNTYSPVSTPVSGSTAITDASTLAYPFVKIPFNVTQGGFVNNVRLSVNVDNPGTVPLVVEMRSPSGKVYPIYDGSFSSPFFGHPQIGERTVVVKSTTSPQKAVSLWSTEPSISASGQWSILVYSRTGSISGISVTSAKVVLATSAAGPSAVASDLAWSSFTYDADNRLETERYPDNQLVFKNTYDTFGRIIRQYDGTGDEAGAAAKFTAYEYFWNGAQLLTNVRDRDDRIRTYTHNVDYQLVDSADGLGNVTEYGYDAKGNMNKVTDTLERTISTGLDASGNVESVVWADAAHMTTQAMAMTYDGNNNLLTASENGVTRMRYRYDAKNNLDQVSETGLTSAGQTGITPRVTSYLYNADSQVLTATRPGGALTTNTYTGGMLTQSVTEGIITTFLYDQVGRVRQMTRGGKTTSYTYTLKDELASITGPLAGQITSAKYDVRGNLEFIIDARGFKTAFEYDKNGRRNKITNAMHGVLVDGLAMNGITTMTYDGEGHILSVTDARGNISRVTYDAEGRPKSVIDPLGITLVSVDYDELGNVTGIRDAYGVHVSAAKYDSLNRPVSATDALNRKIQVTYDALGRLQSFTSARGVTTTFTQDGWDQLAASVDPIANVNYGYDADGNVSSVTNGGVSTSLHWDKLGRLDQELFAGNRTRTFTYADLRGLLTGSTNARGQSTTLTYDDAGRVLGVATESMSTVTYTRDLNGNILTVKNGATGPTSTFVYDALNRVSQFTNENNQVIGYKYDAVGNLTELTYPGGSKVSYSYDAANRLFTVSDWNGRVQRYFYDKNGRVIREERPDGSVLTLDFDSAGQLRQQKDVASTGASIAKYDFIHDAAGNVISESSTSSITNFMGLGSGTDGTVAMTYGADNRLSTFKGTTCVFDDDGNMTSGPASSSTFGTFAYDARNRLTSFGGYTYEYDGMNQLKRITAPDSTTENLVTDPVTGNVLVRTFTGGISASYVHGLGLISTQDSGGVFRCYHYDLRGSTIARTDGTGSIQDLYQYDPYGQLIMLNGVAYTNQTVQPFLYDGRDGVMRMANGLYYMRARFYSPWARRFLNRDPIGLAGGSNVYAFCGSNPINRVDPLGLKYSIVRALLGGFQIAAGMLAVEASIGVTVASGGLAVTAGVVGAFYGGDLFVQGVYNIFNQSVKIDDIGGYVETAAGAYARSKVENKQWSPDKADVFKSNGKLVDATLGALAGGIVGDVLRTAPRFAEEVATAADLGITSAQVIKLGAKVLGNLKELAGLNGNATAGTNGPAILPQAIVNQTSSGPTNTRLPTVPLGGNGGSTSGGEVGPGGESGTVYDEGSTDASGNNRF